MNILDVHKNLTLLRKADEIIEVRIPNSGYKGKDVYAGYFDDIGKCCKAVEKYNGIVPAIYVNLNPINPALLARANNRINEKAGLAAQDSDVIQRSWLYLDIDPVRPAGISSTDGEHNNAIAKAHEINKKQTQEGWSEGIVCDSGNGASLLFRIELLNNEVSTNLIKKVLSAFDFIYSDEKIQIDTSVFNAARIIKLYGTVTKKGDSTTERPHRISAILSIPENINPVSLEQLIDFASRVPEDPQIQAQPIYHNGTFDIQKWMQQHNITVSKKKGWNGGMLYVLDECPFDSNHKSPDACVVQGGSGAIGFRCLHNSCRNHDWKALRAFKEPTRNQTAGKEKKRDIGNFETKNDNQALILINNPKVEPSLPHIFDPAYLTDVYNARQIVEKYGQDIYYVSAWKAWMHWNGQIWERLDEDKQGYPQLLKEWAKDIANSYRDVANTIPNPKIAGEYREHAKRSESDAKIKAMLNLITGERGIMKSYKEFDTNPFLFSCQNGTLNLLTNEFREHRREDYITKISPAAFEPEAQCLRWIAFLERIMKQHPEIIEYLQNFAGQCLTGEVREKSFYIFWGSGGDNGKTTFIETLKYILNEYAQTIPIAALIKENKSAIPVDLHSLNGARFAFASEPDFGEVLTDGLIKRITGKDTMKTRTLHEKPTEWKVQFKLAIATNHQPKISDASGAMWGRVKCVPFIEKIPIEEQDKQLQQKLFHEASGILNWMIEGCREWLAGGMKEPQIVIQTVAEYKEDSDKLADFFNYFFEPKYDGFVPFKIYYTLYKLWCANHEIRPVQENTLPQLLAARGYQRGRGWYMNSKGENTRDRGSFGFTLKKWLTEIPSVQSGQSVPERRNGKLVDRLSGQTLITPVQLILETADTDFEQAKWLSGQVDRLNSVESILLVSCKNNVFNVPSLSTMSQDNGNDLYPISSDSVQSVQSVQNNNSIVIKIKELLDGINKPDSIKELEVLEERILTELQANHDYDNIDGDIIRKMIQDYFKVRGWS